MSVTVKIDTPFEIGDTVYINEEVSERETIKCPFCNGISTVHTGLESYHMIKPYRMYNPQYRTGELVLTCKTCSGTGEITYRKPPYIQKIPVKVIGVDRLHSGGWHCIEWRLETENGTEITRYGDVISME